MGFRVGIVVSSAAQIEEIGILYAALPSGARSVMRVSFVHSVSCKRSRSHSMARVGRAQALA